MIIIGIILILGAIGVFFLYTFLKDKLQENYFQSNDFPTLDGKGQSLSLFRVNGCGLTFSGRFRDFNIENYSTYATYYTLHFFFIPLIPFAAYRVMDGDKGGYHVLGSERGLWAERGLILLKTAICLSGLIGIIMIIVGICD